jgi:hypothetical protein
MRMGVSKKVAEWFIQLDDGGLSFIDTLLYASTSNLHLHKDMLNLRERSTCAVTKITKNCLLKLNVDLVKEKVPTVLYDMVLEWIDPKNRQIYVNENLREYYN